MTGDKYYILEKSNVKFIARYQCVKCDNYNLCEDCYEVEDVHPNHNMMKLEPSAQNYWLPLLVHAKICSMREQLCRLPHCLKMKDILCHIANSHNRKSCEDSLCEPISELVQYWNDCDNQQYDACLPILQALTSE